MSVAVESKQRCANKGSPYTVQRRHIRLPSQCWHIRTPTIAHVVPEVKILRNQYSRLWKTEYLENNLFRSECVVFLLQSSKCIVAYCAQCRRTAEIMPNSKCSDHKRRGKKVKQVVEEENRRGGGGWKQGNRETTRWMKSGQRRDMKRQARGQREKI